MFEGLGNHRAHNTYSAEGYQHLHELVRSHDSTSRHHGRSYSNIKSESFSHLEGECGADVDSLHIGLSMDEITGEKMEISELPAKCGTECVTDTIINQRNEVTVERFNESDFKEPNLTGSEITSGITAVVKSGLPDSLNKNNAANSDQMNNPSRLQSSHKLVTRQSSKKIPFVHGSPPVYVDLPSSPIEELTAKQEYDLSHKGRQFIRSSSIMVKAGGREVSALNTTSSRGFILCKENELREASNKSDLNIFSRKSPSVKNSRSESSPRKSG